MRSFSSSLSPRNRTAIFCGVIAVLFLALPAAEARPSRHRKRAAFSVALQPFSLARSVVHAVAAPVVQNAPRILAATAVSPIRVAYYAPPRLRPRTPRGEQVYEVEEMEEESDLKPIRVAYRAPGRGRTAAPQPEDYDQDQEQEQEEESGRIERRGDRPTVSGSRAVLRNGMAYAPSRAPQNVKNAIWAANTLRRKPYVWGGGHGSFYDRGYDCSGTVSFALHGAGLLNSPLPSSGLMRYGERGRGRWITVYSRPGHTFAVIAGLRLDTTDLDRGGDIGPRWYAYGRDTGGYIARHPVGM
jgi:hypothetical protein